MATMTTIIPLGITITAAEASRPIAIQRGAEEGQGRTWEIQKGLKIKPEPQEFKTHQVKGC